MWKTKNFTGFRVKEFTQEDLILQQQDANKIANLYFENTSLNDQVDDLKQYLDIVYYDENDKETSQEYTIDKNGDKEYNSSGINLKQNLGIDDYLSFVSELTRKYYSFFTWKKYYGFEFHGFDTNQHTKFLSQKWDAEADGTIYN